MKPLLITLKSLRVPVLLACGVCAIASLATAQNYYPPSPVPPDLGFLPGGPSKGQIESVNPIAGNLNLSFPIAQLPPGPGGFTAGVNLHYSSAFYTSWVDDNGSGGSMVRVGYSLGIGGSTGDVTAMYPPNGGGGWSYGLGYTVWDSVTLYAYAPGTGISTYLRTPDGTDHLLLLTSATDANGNAVNFHQLYPDQPIYDIGADGTCQNSIGPCSSPTLYHFQGTLIYASADSTFIRLEVATGNSSTSNSTWKAYFPDGIVVSGSIPWYTATINTTDQILAAESNQIQDKNGNTITVSNFCAEGSLCTTVVADQYNRQISVQYSSNNSYNTSNWTDFVLQPGVNGPLKTTVNWEIYQFTMPTYEAIYAGPNDFRPYQYNDIEYLGVVASIQFPPASKTIPAGTDGPSTVYTFSYPPPSGSLTWGELHGMTRYTLATGTDITPCLQSPPAAGCTQQYQVNYSYYFDNSANHRYMATLVNPLSTKTLLYAENRDGTAAVPLTETTSYSFPVPGPFDPKNPRVGGGVSVTTYPDGSQTYVSSKSLCANSKSGFCSPVVWQIQNRDLTDIEFGWTSNTPPIGAPSGGFYNPYAQYTMQLVGWWQKGVAVTQDVNGNTTNVQENDWFNARLIGPPTGMITGIPGNLARNVTSTYYAPASNPEYWNQRTEPAPAPRYLRALHTTMVCSVNPCDSTNAFATTSYKYDSELTTANLTTESSHDSVSNTDISKTSSYVLPNGSVNGNVVSVTDPKQNVTQTTYDTNNLYPTQMVQAGLRTTNPVYDFNTGVLTSSKDDNSVQTIYTYDSLGRQTVVEEKGNGGLDRTTTTAYDDVGVSVTTTQDQTGLATTTSYDPLGRVRLTSDGAGNRSQRAYRAGTSGVSYELASNPYNSATATDGWTLTTRDLVNGTVTVQTFQGADPPGGLTFAGSPQPPQWGGNTSANSTGQTVTTINEVNTANTCSGPTTNFQDQAGNTTKYCPDAFSRLVGVTDAAGNLTQYSYDLLDDLKQAVQNGQTRSFEYSSLRRLTKACNPETGTADCTVSPLPGTGLESYTYDANGNVSTKADARSVTTTYSGYDGLNRPQSKSYSDGTPTVTYSYDVDWKGALSSVSSTVGTSVYSTGYTHDGFGRIASSTQTAGSAPGYQFVYTYTPADQLATIQYPSGRTVIYTPDSVGRITSVQDKATAKYYANNIAYTPAGGVSSMPMGNGLTEYDTWNDRQQLRGLTVSAGSTSLLGLQFFPCANQATSCSSGNTGNLQGQTIGLQTWTGTQSYTYDALGRLVTATEGAGSWSQSYSYDTAGGTGTSNNRYVSANSGFGLSAFTPTTNTNFDARNRLLVDSATYDPSGNGNQTSIGGSGGYVYTYDAENRMTAAYHGTATTPISSTGYVYDGDGQRVQKITCAAGTNPCTASSAGATVTTYVYDAFGNLAAEYATGAGTNPSCETCFVTADQTGSTRMVTDSYGSVIGVYDYLPFGEEVGAGIGGRTTAMGYTSSPDGFNPKFTGQMRDTETGLDQMGFRYYSPQEGRFITVDPENAGADQANPQTWNGYAYVGNNPLNVTDPMGLGFFDFLEGLIHNILDAATLGFWGGLTAAIEGTSPGPVPGLGGFNLGSLTGCGGPLGNCGTLGAGPWSELTGLGNVQDPGRFIFSAQPGDSSGSWLENVPTIPSWVVNGIAGAGDKLTSIPFTNFSVTVWARRVIPGGDATDTNTHSYHVGGWIGTGYQAVLASAPFAADIAEVQAGKLFGTRFGGNQPLLNSNDTLRIGWSYIKSTGQYVFRIGGKAVGYIKSNPHINLWPPSWWFK